MSDNNPVKDLGLTCPFGGVFYICADGPDRFIGCCTINPCGARKGLCPDENLRSASFNATLQHECLPQACINDNVDVSWYACIGEALPFLGCCALDPCLRGVCAQGDLRAAKLSGNARNAQDFLDGGPEYMPRPTSSFLDPGLFITSASLCASSVIAMPTIISSFITSFATETVIATITSSMTALPSEAPDASPTRPKEHCSNQKLGWLWVILLVGIVLLVVLAHYIGESPSCCLECGDKLFKIKVKRRHEQEHLHEQTQQQGYELNSNMPRYPDTDEARTSDDSRNMRESSSRNSSRTTHEHPENSQGQHHQNGPTIKEVNSRDNKENGALGLHRGSSQQGPYAYVPGKVPNRKPLPGTNNQTSWRGDNSG
ncbi:hypothetical protein FGADI_499 [Fusarium gaditjirri]|uniref:C2H2-type domain-containing protein n=1 Tax=Fusarium gaditjirri TaxID=282569 RepID=A0A8H4X402_9HYPO|nr:hypothetical protein FGADI_499 [Fusarium gaditjirri]